MIYNRFNQWFLLLLLKILLKIPKQSESLVDKDWDHNMSTPKSKLRSERCLEKGIPHNIKVP